MALVTYHACDRCGEKRDKPHNLIDVVIPSKAPEKGASVLVTTPFGAVVRKQLELCDKCSGVLAEFVEKFLKT